MGRSYARSRAYAKVPQEKKGDKPRRKQRKIIPKFSDNFLEKDENTQPENSNDLFDSFNLKQEKTKDVSKKWNSRNSLAATSSFTNCTIGSVGHISINDTFDKFARVCKHPQARFGLGCSSSTSGSSVDASGVLYKSFFSIVNSGKGVITANKAESTEALTAPIITEEAPKIRVQTRPEATIEEEKLSSNCQSGSLSKNVEIPSALKQVLSPQLFTSQDEDFVAVGSGWKLERQVPRKYALRNQKCSSIKERKSNSAKGHTSVLRSTDKGKSDKSCTVDKVIAAKENYRIACSPHNAHLSPWIKRFRNRISTEIPTVQKSHSPKCKTPSNINDNPAGHQGGSAPTSSSSSQSGQLKSKEFLPCTSTPTENCKNQNVQRKGSYLSSPTLEHSVSPFPCQNSMVVEERSSVFESPVYANAMFKSCPIEFRYSSSVGSKYETCRTSNEEKESNVMSQSKIPQVLVDDDYGTENEKFIVPHKSFYNSAFKIDSGPFKGACIPALAVAERSPIQVTPPDQASHISSESPSTSVEEQFLVPADESQVIGKRRAAATQKAEPPSGPLLSKRRSMPTFASPCLQSPRKTRYKSKQEKYGMKLHTGMSTKNSLRNSLKINILTSERLTEVEESIIFIRKTVKKKGEKLIPDVIIKNTSSISNNSVSDTASNNEDSVELAGKLTSDISLFPLNTQSPILTRKQARVNHSREISSNAYSDMIHDGNHQTLHKYSLRYPRKNNSFTGKVATRKSKRLSVMTYVTIRCNKNSERNRERKFSSVEFSDLSLRSGKENSSVSDTRRSKSSVTGARKNHVRNHSTISIGNEGESESLKEIPESDVSQCEIQSDSMAESSIAENVKRSRRSKSHMENCSTSLSPCQGKPRKTENNFSLTSNNMKGSPIYSTQELEGLRKSIIQETSLGSSIGEVCIQDSAQERVDVSMELKERLESQSFFATPAKPGKGWKRSHRSLAVLQASFAEYEDDRVRRQTMQFLAANKRNLPNLRMSVIPPEISRRIQQLERSMRRELHSRSSLQVTFLNNSDSNQALALPTDPRERVIRLCSQVEPLPMSDCFTDSRLASCKKIGEGVYGEVFMTRPNPASLEDACVLKIMPIEGDFEVNGEPQKNFDEIMSEIIISMELSNLRNPNQNRNWTENYVHLLKCWCVQGSYHQDLLHQWDQFNEEKCSENDRPDIFPEGQLYVILEFGHGGGDLESYVFNNARDAQAVFFQIAYSMAVAEHEREFEHRDLHWGNVLVAPTRETSLKFTVNSETYTLKTHGLKATTIDFTLSRLKTEHCVVYNNLAEDPSLFTAEGDYQFEIYRQMKKANGNEWESFTPYTNVLWLDYLLDKMLTQCYYKNIKTKVHTTHLAHLARIKENMLGYESAMHFVLSRELQGTS